MSTNDVYKNIPSQHRLPNVSTQKEITSADMMAMHSELNAYKAYQRRADINEFLYPKFRNVSLNRIPV